MTDYILNQRRVLRQRRTKLLLVCSLALQPSLFAQADEPVPGRGAAAAASKPGMPFDMTGYWVSVVTTTDWRFRMVVPPKGDYFGFRMTPEASKIANTWDPAKDEAAGNQCKFYGAAGIMRIPGRLHITQPDEKTLRMDLDAGTQTRLFHFGDGVPAGSATWQGDSVAQWDKSGTGGLKVTTRHMRGGYLSRNGVPYSENAVLTEYYDLVRERNGDQRLVVTSSVEDPAFLQQPYAGSYHFKKQRDASGWDPSACSARW